MKTDEWIVGVLAMGGGRTACSCEVFQGWMPELGISTANFFNCIDLFQFYFSVSLMWALFFFTCLIILQTHRAHLCDTSLCYVWNNLFPLFWRLSFFSKRSICGSHGLLVFMTLPGPVLLLFFSPAQTRTHSGPLLLTLNFILCCSCICCHHGDLVYDLTPLARKHAHTHCNREIDRLRLPLCLIWCYRTHRITAPSKPRPICINTHTHSSWPGWLQQTHAKHRAISATLPNHLQAGLDNDIC